MPEIPPIQRRIAEKPRHAAVSGQRDPRTRRRTEDSTKWSVIDLTEPEPTTTELPAGAVGAMSMGAMSMEEIAPAAAVAASAGGALMPPLHAFGGNPAVAAAGPTPTPKVLRLEPLGHFSKSEKPAKPGHDQRDAPRKRSGSDFTPYYRPVGELSYVAAPSGGPAGGR